MERFLRWWAVFSLNEVTYAILPWLHLWLLLAALLWFFWGMDVLWMLLVSIPGLLYVISTYIHTRVARYWSKRVLGLQRYILIPIPRWVACVLVRRGMDLPRGKRYFMLHIGKERVGFGQLKKEMQDDVRAALAASWTRGAVFLGNTNRVLAKMQKRMLKGYGNLETIEGTFLPGQTLVPTLEEIIRKKTIHTFFRKKRKRTWEILKFEP